MQSSDQDLTRLEKPALIDIIELQKAQLELFFVLKAQSAKFLEMVRVSKHREESMSSYVQFSMDHLKSAYEMITQCLSVTESVMMVESPEMVANMRGMLEQIKAFISTTKQNNSIPELFVVAIHFIKQIKTIMETWTNGIRANRFSVRMGKLVDLSEKLIKASEESIKCQFGRSIPEIPDGYYLAVEKLTNEIDSLCIKSSEELNKRDKNPEDYGLPKDTVLY